MNEKDNDVINALKRLERAGAEDSRTTEKLRDAARSLAEKIEEIVPHEVDLPRGYRVISRVSNGPVSFDYLVHDFGEEDEEYIDSCKSFDYYQNGDFNVRIPGQTRRGIMQFAEDVASGWLDEVAAFMEARAKKADKASATLVTAMEKLQK